MTWGKLKKAAKRADVTDADVVTGFRWINHRDGKYFVTTCFEGRREGITLDTTGARETRASRWCFQRVVNVGVTAVRRNASARH